MRWAPCEENFHCYRGSDHGKHDDRRYLIRQERSGIFFPPCQYLGAGSNNAASGAIAHAISLPVSVELHCPAREEEQRPTGGAPFVMGKSERRPARTGRSLPGSGRRCGVQPRVGKKPSRALMMGTEVASHPHPPHAAASTSDLLDSCPRTTAISSVENTRSMSRIMMNWSSRFPIPLMKPVRIWVPMRGAG